MEEVRARAQFKFGVGSALGRSFSSWFRNIIPFTVLMFVAHLPLLVYWYLFLQPGPVVRADAGESAGDSSGVETAVDFDVLNSVTEYAPTVLALLVTGAMVFRVYEQLGGKRPRMGECVRVGIKRLGPVLGVGITTAIAWFVPMAVAAEIHPAAILIAWIPSVVFLCMFVAAVPIAVVERRGIFGAIKRSVYLTRGHRFSVALFYLVLGALQVVAGLILGFVVAVSSADWFDVPFLVWTAIGMAMIFGSLTITASTVVYYDLRLVKEGVGVDELKDVFA